MATNAGKILAKEVRRFFVLIFIIEYRIFKRISTVLDEILGITVPARYTSSVSHFVKMFLANETIELRRGQPARRSVEIYILVHRVFWEKLASYTQKFSTLFHIHTLESELNMKTQ